MYSKSGEELGKGGGRSAKGCTHIHQLRQPRSLTSSRYFKLRLRKGFLCALYSLSFLGPNGPQLKQMEAIYASAGLWYLIITWLIEIKQ